MSWTTFIIVICFFLQVESNDECINAENDYLQYINSVGVHNSVGWERIHVMNEASLRDLCSAVWQRRTGDTLSQTSIVPILEGHKTVQFQTVTQSPLSLVDVLKCNVHKMFQLGGKGLQLLIHHFYLASADPVESTCVYLMSYVVGTTQEPAQRLIRVLAKVCGVLPPIN